MGFSLRWAGSGGFSPVRHAWLLETDSLVGNFCAQRICPANGAALEVLHAAAVGESADLVGDGVAEFAFFVAQGAPGGADGAPGGVGAGGWATSGWCRPGTPGSSRRWRARRSRWRRGSRVCRFRSPGLPQVARMPPQVARAPVAGRPVDGAALEALVAAAAGQAADLVGDGVAEFAFFVAQGAPGGTDARPRWRGRRWRATSGWCRPGTSGSSRR